MSSPVCFRGALEDIKQRGTILHIYLNIRFRRWRQNNTNTQASIVVPDYTCVILNIQVIHTGASERIVQCTNMTWQCPEQPVYPWQNILTQGAPVYVANNRLIGRGACQSRRAQTRSVDPRSWTYGTFKEYSYLTRSTRLICGMKPDDRSVWLYYVNQG